MVGMVKPTAQPWCLKTKPQAAASNKSKPLLIVFACGHPPFRVNFLRRMSQSVCWCAGSATRPLNNSNHHRSRARLHRWIRRRSPPWKRQKLPHYGSLDRGSRTARAARRVPPPRSKLDRRPSRHLVSRSRNQRREQQAGGL